MSKSRAYRFQKQAIRKIEGELNGRVLLADEMGLGKTFQSIKVIERNKRYMTPGLVICPSPLKYNWLNEVAKHSCLNSLILEGAKPQKGWRMPTADLYIINYEILKGWLPRLLRLDAQTIVLDESHRIKSRSAKTTKHVNQLVRYSPHLFALSGTPILNEPNELYTTVKALWPHEFASFWTYAQRYTNAEMKPWGWSYTGSRNLDELHERLRSLGMIRRRRKDVLKDLPGRSIALCPFKLSRKDFHEYEQAKTDFIKWLSKISKQKAIKAKRAEAVTKVGYLLRLAAKLKLPQTMQWIDQFLEGTETTEKLIVFGTHKEILRELHTRYKKGSVLINGEVTGTKRQRALEAFQKSPTKRIAFCNIRSAGVGLNMQHASHVHFVEMPWTPAEVDQAISRADRMGQTNKVMVTFSVAMGTLEEKQFDKLKVKQSVASQAIDGESGTNQNDMYRALIAELKS